MRLGSGAGVTLTEDDAKAIVAECPAVSMVAPTVRGAAQVMFGNSNWATSIQGTTPDYLKIRDLAVQSGRAFTDDARQYDWFFMVFVVLAAMQLIGGYFLGRRSAR